MSTSRARGSNAIAALALAAAVSLAAQTPPAGPAAQSPVAHPPAPVGPGLGVPATAAELAGLDISVAPDGAGLPPGSGTPAQGAQVFAAKCVMCHGVEGQNGVNDRLVGGQGTIASAAPVKTVGSYWPYATTVFDYVRRAMPYPAPHSLTDDEAYAVTAYLLHLNGIIGPGQAMDATTLPAVRMPNRDGFVRAYPDAAK